MVLMSNALAAYGSDKGSSFPKSFSYDTRQNVNRREALGVNGRWAEFRFTAHTEEELNNVRRYIPIIHSLHTGGDVSIL